MFFKPRTDAYIENGGMDEDGNGAHDGGGIDHSAFPSREQESQAPLHTRRSNVLLTP